MKSGDKIICIDDSIRAEIMPTVLKYYKNWVQKDKIYTIREIVENKDIVPGVLLSEIKNEAIYIELIDKTQEPAFGMFRFAIIEDTSLEEVSKEYLEV